MFKSQVAMTDLTMPCILKLDHENDPISTSLFVARNPHFLQQRCDQCVLIIVGGVKVGRLRQGSSVAAAIGLHRFGSTERR